MTQGKSRLVSVFLVATLTVVAGYSVAMPRVDAQGFTINLQSRELNGASVNLGEIAVNGPFQSLPSSIIQTQGHRPIQYRPAADCRFVRWESSGPSITFANPIENPTEAGISGAGTLTAVYERLSVGGIILPKNSLTVLAPYLAVIGLIATAAIAVKRKLVY